ncbi:MAG: aminoacyl-tRNA hydrolase [Candidatus Omnitrophica bacterium]|nr:aminoacyl-tRNA hydrolase [Candidatus Omnitrophota bacterium]MCM8809048.1 aminoacyl-tRNA hydrolase [Candidatus Omnitrophota bacterium]MCM8811179.1 aminoacyl-tRNA hydrolase [Candidatus Omnitrophota bacterium]MCM8832890.1 aminoacyl-tRNA hydrolase [Candidatus Omnitrophota bacterium]
MIFVGLGNPGIEYQETRHNVGFKVIERLKKNGKIIKVYRKKFFNGWDLEIEGKEIIIVKPKTYMNESGKAVKVALEFFNKKIEDLFLIHDELAIELGKIKITKDKGPGGHKGVISTIENLQSNNFVRIRIGIKGEKIEKSFIDYVLSPFLPEEQEIIERVIEKSVNAIKEILRSNLEKAMSLYNN